MNAASLNLETHARLRVLPTGSNCGDSLTVVFLQIYSPEQTGESGFTDAGVR